MKIFTFQLKFLVIVFLISSECFSQSTATYDISLTTTWNVTEHSSVPGNAHWSDLIGATHNTANEFVELGQLATVGIKNVAESGSNAAITSEINAAITAGNANQLLQNGFSTFGAISSAGFTDIIVSEDFPLITLVSMVAPSPDWFIAINSLNLRNDSNTDWKNTFTVDVFTYDSGTDSGTNYTSGNQVTNPAQPISMINGFPVNGNKMATITFTLKSVLSIDDFNSVDSINIYPNPSRGIISITNTINLNTIEVYNVLGNLVKQVNLENNYNINKFNLNLTDLNSGIYITKLIDNQGKSKTQKLIIE